MRYGIVFLVTACASLGLTPAVQAAKVDASQKEAAAMNGAALPTGSPKNYGKGVLKAEEVKACVALAAKINASDKDVNEQKQSVHSSVSSFNEENAAVKKMDADLDTEQVSLDARTKALAAERAAINTSNKDAVAALNAKSETLEKDKAAYHVRTKEFNERVGKLKVASSNSSAVDVAGVNDKAKRLDKQLDEFDDKCGFKDYYADDYAAAKAALKP